MTKNTYYGFSKETEKLQCKICEASLSTAQALKRHVATAHSTNVEIEKLHMCDICEFSSKTYAELMRHNLNIHLKQKRFQCSECKKRFGTELLRNKHASEVHGNKEDIKIFQCTKCEYSTKHQGSLTNHFRVIHLKVIDYKCDICQRTFGFKPNLRRHMALVHKDLSQANNQKVHKCDQCDYTSVLKRNVQRHVLAKHEKSARFECLICQKKFVYESTFTRHQASHKTKEELRYQCKVCDYKADDKAVMSNHERFVHAKEKRFSCQLCSYTATYKTHVERHMKTHSKENESKWRCEFCMGNFKTKLGLTLHKKSAHHEEIEKEKH